MKKVFFVTASIACGKSSFMQIAKEKGYEICSADEIAHHILNEKRAEIYELFKDKISKNELIKDEKIDRKALGALVFKDKKELKKLEAFLHPRIKAEILAFIKANKDTVFIEIPLFFESKNYENLGKCILIYSKKQEIIKRLMKRENIDEKEALNRLSLQMDIEEKKKMADIVIENLSDFENFKKNCENFFKDLENEAL